MVETYNAAYFWLEVVAQFVIGISGFVANLVVIPILCRSLCALRFYTQFRPVSVEVGSGKLRSVLSRHLTATFRSQPLR